jgi:hypothetical protein
MADHNQLDDFPLSYQEFYSEIPGNTDYLNDLDPAIYDEHESDSESTRGLSAEQVSEIARDSLDGTHQVSAAATDDPQLFPDDPQQR